MRKQIKAVVIVSIWLLVPQPSALAQGTLNFDNRVPGLVDAPIVLIDGVTRVAGDQWRAQLWFGPSRTVHLMQPLFPSTIFGTGESAGYVLPVPELPVPGFAGGEHVYVQFRVWDSFTGATWQTASIRGLSPVLLVGPLGDAAADPSIPPANLVGLQGFSIPEPSTVALAVFGAFVLLGWRAGK
jgi:hypothetical protein